MATSLLDKHIFSTDVELHKCYNSKENCYKYSAISFGTTIIAGLCGFLVPVLVVPLMPALFFGFSCGVVLKYKGDLRNERYKELVNTHYMLHELCEYNNGELSKE